MTPTSHPNLRFIVRAIKEIDGSNIEVMPVAHQKEGKTIPMEKELLMPILRGRNVRRWRILWEHFYTLFPHVRKDGKLVPIPEEDMKQQYPNAYRYLQSHKAVLESRRD